MRSWNLNAIIKNRGVDYLALARLSFSRKLNNDRLGLRTVVFF